MFFDLYIYIYIILFIYIYIYHLYTMHILSPQEKNKRCENHRKTPLHPTHFASAMAPTSIKWKDPDPARLRTCCGPCGGDALLPARIRKISAHRGVPKMGVPPKWMVYKGNS